MAQLQQIVGALIRDVALARVSSDIFSRDVSRYYEQDPLLRRFPVPRTEVDEVEIDLKFVVAGLEASKVQGSGSEATLAPVFAQAAYDLANWYCADLLKRAEELEPAAGAEEGWGEFLRKVGRTSWRVDLHSDLLHELERNQGHLIEGGTLDPSELEKILRTRLRSFLQAHLERVGLTGEQVPGLEALPKSSPGLRAGIERLAERVKATLATGGDCEVDVDVTAASLHEAPPQAVSSVRIKAHVRNYTWSEIGEVEGQPWRRLSPE